MNSTKRVKKLTKDQATAIYRHKLHPIYRHTASRLADEFGVSVKTVRDVWSGRTWLRATYHLMRKEKVDPRRLTLAPGRPRGSKDKIRRGAKKTTCYTFPSRLPPIDDTFPNLALLSPMLMDPFLHDGDDDAAWRALAVTSSARSSVIY